MPLRAQMPIMQSAVHTRVLCSQSEHCTARVQCADNSSYCSTVGWALRYSGNRDGLSSPATMLKAKGLKLCTNQVASSSGEGTFAQRTHPGSRPAPRPPPLRPSLCGASAPPHTCVSTLLHQLLHVRRLPWTSQKWQRLQEEARRCVANCTSALCPQKDTLTSTHGRVA